MTDAHFQVGDARESAIVGAVMIAPTLLDSMPFLSPDDFRDERLGMIFATIRSRHQRGEPVDVVAIAESFDRSGALAEKLGPDAVPFLIGLTNAPLIADAAGHARQLHEEAKRRRLVSRLELIRNSAANDSTFSSSALSRMLTEAAEGIAPHETEERFRFLTMQELADADLRMEFVIRGILARGLTGGIFGPSKGMKTSLMLAAAYSAASGVPFLGMFEVVRPCRVLIMSSESGLATIRSTLARISAWGGIDYRNLPIVVSDDVPTLTDAADIAAVERAIVKTGADLVFLDPFYHMAGDAAADMANQLAMGRVLKQMPMLGKRTGATIIYAHHLRKVTLVGEPTGLPDIQGSGHDAHVRQWWCLNRRTPFDPESGRGELWLNVGSSLGFSRLLAVDIDEGVMDDDGNGRHWSVTVNDPYAARSAATKERQQKRETEKWQQAQATRQVRIDKLLTAYKSRPEGETKTVLRNLAGVSATIFDDVNADLLRCGAVVTEERQKHTRTEMVFRLVDGWDLKVSQLSSYGAGDDHAAA